MVSTFDNIVGGYGQHYLLNRHRQKTLVELDQGIKLIPEGKYKICTQMMRMLVLCRLSHAIKPVLPVAFYR